MINKENFIKNIYKKSENLNTEDDFYNNEVYKLNEKNKFISYKIVANFIFIFILLGTVGTIAFTTYKSLSNKPSYNWSDGSVKFNEKYDKYSKSIGEIVGTHNETELKLVSQNYDGGFVVLEFDLKLDQKDKEYLKIGENTFSSNEIEEYRNSFNHFADERINSYDPNLSDEENKQHKEKWENEKVKYEEELKKMSLEKNTVKLLFNHDLDNLYTYKIDNKKYCLSDCEKQQVEQLGDLEYKIYMMYFVPDECIENKDNFTMEFESVMLTSTSDKNVLSKINDGLHIDGGRIDNENIKLYGNIVVDINKNTNEIDLLQFDKKNIQHDILTENIEYVKVTPMQTIIKVKANLNGLKKNSLTVGWFNWDDLDLIGDISFNVYNENGESIGNSIIESKRFFWYENGDFEEWEPHQLVPNNEDRSSIGGDLQMFEYIIISNSDYKSTLKIFPMITKGTEDDRRIFVEIGDFFELKFD